MRKYLILLLSIVLLLTTSCSLSDKDSGDGGVCEHIWGEWITVSNATCSESGLERRVCLKNSNHVESKETVKLDHLFDEGEVTTEPTESEEGEMTFTCTVCGAAKVEKIPIREPSDDTFDPEEPVTITFYHSMGVALRIILDSSIEDFNRLYPNITVRHESLGSYDGLFSQIRGEMAVGEAPSLALSYPDHVAFYKAAGKALALDTFIEDETYGLTDAELSNFIPGFYEEGKQYGDGVTYTLPLGKSTDVLYYNKTFFEENGLAVPTTWEDMERVCRIIKEKHPNDIPLGYDSESNLFITMCEQLGGDYVSSTGEFLFDNDTNKGFVKELREWYRDGLMTTSELLGGYTSSLFLGEWDEGVRCYMSVGSSGGAAYYQPATNSEYGFEVGVAPLPQIDSSSSKTLSQGPSICIFDNGNAQESMAAWLFAKHLATDELYQGSVSMKYGYLPVIKSVLNNPIYAEFLGSDSLTSNVISMAFAEMDSYFAPPTFVGSSVARDQVGKLLLKCLAEEMSNVDEMIDELFREAIQSCEYLSERT